MSLKNRSIYILQKAAKRFPPVLLLFISLLSTGVLTLLVHELTEREESLRFARAKDSVISAMLVPLRVYESALNATRSFILTEGNPSQKEFAAFVRGFDLAIRYPGLEGIGYASRKNNQSFILTHFESFQKTPTRVIGHDISLTPEGKFALEKCADSGELTFSRKVTSTGNSPSFLLLMPVYDPNLPANTVEERRHALRGFIYSPTPTRQLFTHILKELKADPTTLRVRIYDGPNVNSEDLLFDSHPQALDTHSPRYQKIMSFPYHNWSIQLESTPAFESPLVRRWVVVFFSLGVVISLLATTAIAVAKRLNEELQEDLLRKIKSEEKLLKAREEAEAANASKSRFLANMSHEIRTPLGVVVGFADLAMEHPHLDPELRKYLKAIKHNGQELVSLVGQVLDISKIEANRMVLEITKFSLPQLLEEIIFSLSLRASEKNISLVWDQSHPIPEYIKTDRTKLRQILVNLINNAIKFTGQGGVRLMPRLLTSTNPDAPMEIEILVTDTGIGMSEQFKKDLFKAYSQAEPSTARLYGGTGLGLNLSKQLAQMLGGDVTLQSSQPQKGSVFALRIKAGAFENYWQGGASFMENNNNTVKTNEKSLRKVRISQAERNIINKNLFKSYLAATGAQLDLACDGLEAVQLASTNTYDLIILDIEMPQLNGYGVLKFLREENNYQKPVIALSAHAFQEEQQKALRSGFDAYLSKPILRTEFISEIQYVLKNSLSGVKKFQAPVL